jgi:hypothetical protein
VEQRYLESHTINMAPGTDGCRGQPKWPSGDALHTSRRSLKEAKEAHTTEEFGDQFDPERELKFWLPHITVEFWKL